MLAKLEPFYSWHTPIAWTGYIFSVDGLVWTRRGSSWMVDARAELLFLAAASVPLWVIFEMYNKYWIHNWHYVGLPESLPVRYFGYVWSFATIWPAIFETGDLVSTLRGRAAPAGAFRAERFELRAVEWISVAAGAAMLAVPVVYPSPYLAAPVWLGFFFLLDPLNARAGSDSIFGDARRGRYGRLVNLLAAGLICGILWEFWNYWAGTRWRYTVPILPELRIFEMPVLGYGGFPAFALECFAMYVTLRRWVWRAPARPISL